MEEHYTLEEEIDGLRCIYGEDDFWTLEEDSHLAVYVKVPFTDGEATVICKLPKKYPVKPLAPTDVTIQGVPSEKESELLTMLQLQGLLLSEDAAYGRAGESVLFLITSAIREALDFEVTADMMAELLAEANETADQEGDENEDPAEDADSWQKYESQKKEQSRAAAEARRLGTQQTTVDAASESTQAALTGKAAYRARLQAGETVSFRGGGNSLAPLIKSGEKCTYAPVFRHEDVKERDVVFCQIKGRFWEHMVKHKTLIQRGRDGDPDVYKFTISNIHGHENGDCKLEHIYGRVVAVSK